VYVLVVVDHMMSHDTPPPHVLTSRLHHLVELGLNVQLRVLSLHTLQLDGYLYPRLDVGT
jgi:hypothetical protein